MLDDDIIQNLIDKFQDKTIIYTGCNVKKINFSFCYNDVVIFPSDLSPTIFDEKNKIIIYGLQEEKSLFKEEAIPIYDPNFKYNLVIAENKSTLIKKVLGNSLKKSIRHLSEFSSLGSVSFYASVARLIEPAVIITGTSLSPSHIFNQVVKENSEILKQIFEILQIDSNIGSILRRRAETLAFLMDKSNSKIFLMKIYQLMDNKRELEASVYFFHELSKLEGKKLKAFPKDFKFGEISEKKKNEAVELIKMLTQKLNDF
ncbi:MAG: hypothetical protein ACP5LX_02500 [Nitrososphaeria archaeon]